MLEFITPHDWQIISATYYIFVPIWAMMGYFGIDGNRIYKIKWAAKMVAMASVIYFAFNFLGYWIISVCE